MKSSFQKKELLGLRFQYSKGQLWKGRGKHEVSSRHGDGERQVAEGQRGHILLTLCWVGSCCSPGPRSVVESRSVESFSFSHMTRAVPFPLL